MTTTLAGALPETIAAFEKLRELAAAEGIEYGFAAFGGVRSLADTTKILGYRTDDYAAYVKREKAAGRSPVDIQTFRPIAPFGDSHHNFGGAGDVYPSKWPAGKSQQWAVERLGALAPRAGLRWGGTFPKPDRPHFELAVTLADLRARYAARGGAAGVPLATLPAFIAAALPVVTTTPAASSLPTTPGTIALPVFHLADVAAVATPGVKQAAAVALALAIGAGFVLAALHPGRTDRWG